MVYVGNREGGGGVSCRRHPCPPIMLSCCRPPEHLGGDYTLAEADQHIDSRWVTARGMLLLVGSVSAPAMLNCDSVMRD
jgi:hypothetical protein